MSAHETKKVRNRLIGRLKRAKSLDAQHRYNKSDWPDFNKEKPPYCLLNRLKAVYGGKFRIFFLKLFVFGVTTGQFAHPRESFFMLVLKIFDKFKLFHRGLQHVKTFEEHCLMALCQIKLPVHSPINATDDFFFDTDGSFFGVLFRKIIKKLS